MCLFVCFVCLFVCFCLIVWGFLGVFFLINILLLYQILELIMSSLLRPFLLEVKTNYLIPLSKTNCLDVFS